MKKIMAFVSVMAAFAAVAVADTLSLAEARGRIGEAVLNPAVMTSTMKMLSAADQKIFLADCNDAIAKMPGSGDTKASAFLVANRAALKGAAKGNVAALIAEVFATVPTEALTVINERFASDLFNRASDPSVVYTDDQFVGISKAVMAAVAERNSKTDGAAVRNAFAVLMLVRASNGTPADLAEKLSDSLPAENRQTIVKEWIPAAMDGNYDPMLGAADAGMQPNASAVLRIAGPQTLETMLADVSSSIAGADASKAASFNNVVDVVTTIQAATPDLGMDSGLDRRPLFRVEPNGYQWQTIGSGER
jgi:hypothetical protein